MRVYVLTVFVFILTRGCSGVTGGDHLASSDPRSLKFGTEPFDLGSRNINHGRVRFEENTSKEPYNHNFFPVEHDDEGVNIEEALLNGDERPDNNNFYLTDSEIQDNLTKDIYKNNIYGQVVFKDDGKKKDREVIRKKKRKMRERPDNRDLALGYPEYSDYGSQHLTTSSTNFKRPLYYTTGYKGSLQNFGLNPVHPSVNTNPAINTGHIQQYAAHDSAAAGLSQISGRPGIPSKPEFTGIAYSGYFPQTGQPVTGQYGYLVEPGLLYGQPGFYPGYPGPNRRPKSLTQQAVSAVTEALTSVALFDDKQCVPRILCEVASGRVAGSSTMLKATAGIEPLLGMLQAYNGVSSSPLFIFGRAAVLGFTSVGNTIACHRAYPQCPNDPTELIHYLNNHNGGFFRFFGQPARPQKQQNLEQFYNHLAGQDNQLHSYSNIYSNGYPHVYPKNKLPDYQDESDTATNTNSKVLDIETASSEIQERIQNKPDIGIINEEVAEDGSKWTFPEETYTTNNGKKPRRSRKHNYVNATPERGDSPLKFPNDRGPAGNKDLDGNRDYITTQKLIFFPSGNSLDSQYNNYQTNTALNDLGNFIFDYNHGFYVRRPKQVNNKVFRTDEADLVYILRGNADPNHPEIVRVKPGQGF